MAELPCDVDGKCMVCDQPPAPEELVCCNSCGSDWHAACLANAPEEPDVWQCPDCEPAAASGPCIPHQAAAPSDIVSKIRAIQDDASLSEREKARLRQDVLSGGRKEEKGKPGKSKSNGTLDILTDNLRCTMCLELCDRPVTTPCGHSSCLRCFQKYIAQGNKKCDKCRATIPPRMASEPRINAQMVLAIRMAKNGEQSAAQRPVSKPSAAVLENEKRPDKAFRSERAVKSGKANACSGRVFVKVPRDHLGPILAEHMADGEQAAFVGQSWEDRMECRQYGVHLPHVAGIAGRADFGAQSVALSGGYEDDEDHGDWFLYTGSGGRDLSGNKRTNKEQSFDQKFEKSNEALRESCRKGYPVRVVRSHKEKRSSYAPEMGVRYDGIYRIEMCWRKKGIQGFRVCRYLFVRCDNEPAPWASDEHGDRPRPLPIVAELKDATDITERKGSPFWDWHQESAQWGWSKPAPPSKSEGPPVLSEKRKRRETVAGEQKLLRQFGCGLCHKILELPLSTPCGHNFCKPCLEASCSSQEDTRQRGGARSSSLRVRKPVRRCPTCKTDISESYDNLQVNRHLEDIIESIRKKQKTEDSSVADEDMSSDDTEE